MRLVKTEILGQNIKVAVSPLGDAWNKDEINIPDDLETGKAIEEVYTSLKEVLIKEYGLGEDYLFFPAPPLGFVGVLYSLSAVRTDHLPPEVAKRPDNFWYDRTQEEWCKIN